MLIERFRLTGHPGIGDMALDFRDASGAPAPVVVLAGANGTGKTAILEAIQRVFELRPPGPGRVELDVELTEQELSSLKPQIARAVYDFDGRRITLGRSSGASVDITLPGLPHPWGVDIGPKQNVPLTSFFSTAFVNYPIANHTGIAANDFDRSGGQSRTSTIALGNEIGQLLVDIRSADAQDTWDWVTAHPGEPVPDEVPNRRSQRFQRAIEFILPRKRLASLVRTGNKIDVTFEQGSIRSSLEVLSSGEQQVIVRGAFVIREAGTLRDAIVLIDEPELSLHPDWQGRIIDFYRHVLDDGTGHHPQIICATHSPFVVHGTTNGKVIVLERAGDVVRAMDDPIYPAAGALVAVRAFNLDSFVADLRQDLVVLTEGPTDVRIIEKAWASLYGSEPMPFEVKPAEGARPLGQALNDQHLFAKLGLRRIIGIFDFDTAFDHWRGVWHSKRWNGGNALASEFGSETEGVVRKHASGQAWAMLLPRPEFRPEYASLALGRDSILSIEFLFEDADHLRGMIGTRSIARSQSLPYVHDSFKALFAEHVEGLGPTSFESFKPLFSRLRQAADGTL